MPELDVLAIAAHRDDAEITSGGLLLKMASLGRKTGIIDLTLGEMGTYGDEHNRAAEAKTAADVLRLSFRENLLLPDSAVELTQENKLKLAAQIRATRPELVILPHWEQRHPDHRICSQLGFDACFLAGLKKIDLSGKPHRPRKIIYASYYRNREFSFLVDISAHFEQKCEAVRAYTSQFGEPESSRQILVPGIDVFELMRTRAAYLGQLVGVQYAEAYTIKERILIDDPQTMPVQSI